MLGEQVNDLQPDLVAQSVERCGWSLNCGLIKAGGCDGGHTIVTATLALNRQSVGSHRGIPSRPQPTGLIEDCRNYPLAVGNINIDRFQYMRSERCGQEEKSSLAQGSEGNVKNEIDNSKLQEYAGNRAHH